jgi:hypothetical protein
VSEDARDDTARFGLQEHRNAVLTIAEGMKSIAQFLDEDEESYLRPEEHGLDLAFDRLELSRDLDGRIVAAAQADDDLAYGLLRGVGEEGGLTDWDEATSWLCEHDQEVAWWFHDNYGVVLVTEDWDGPVSYEWRIEMPPHATIADACKIAETTAINATELRETGFDGTLYQHLWNEINGAQEAEEARRRDRSPDTSAA